MIKKWITVCALVFVGFSLVTVNAWAAVSINSLEKSIHAENDFDNFSTITMETEHEVYGTDVKSITLIITNNSAKPITYGTSYVLEAYNNGQWYKVPFKEGAALNDVAIAVTPSGSKVERISLPHEAFRFAKGQYRVVKKIANNLYQAKFQLGKSLITGETPYGFLTMEKLPPNYTRREAATAGDIVITQEGVINNDAYAVFLEKVNIGIPAMLRITNVEDLRNPKVMDIIYDEYFFVREANLANLSKTPIKEEVYSYLNTEGNHVYLSNYISRKISTAYGNTDNVRIPLQNESEAGKKAAEKIRDTMNGRMLGNITPLTVYSPDRLLNVSLESSPLKFAVSGVNGGTSVDLVDEKNIADKIMDIQWIDNTHFMLTCDTSKDQKYFAVYEAKKMHPTLILAQYGLTAPKNTLTMILKGNS